LIYLGQICLHASRVFNGLQELLIQGVELTKSLLDYPSLVISTYYKRIKRVFTEQAWTEPSELRIRTCSENVQDSLQTKM
jgi:hypothetical protein